MKRVLSVVFWSLLGSGGMRAADALEAGFAAPPESTKPWCYWYWISDHLSCEGITADLEAMARVGIGEALIGNIFLDQVPAGPVKVLTDEWWGMVGHALREGTRTGVNLGMFNCPGWSQSGGPWIQPAQSMRRLAIGEARVTGPTTFRGPLPPAGESFQDVALLAFPAPADDADRLPAHAPQLACQPAAPGLVALFDGDPDTAFDFPGQAGRGKRPFAVEVSLAQPRTVRTLQVFPADTPLAADVVLETADAGGDFRELRRFRFDRSNLAVGVGFLPRAPVTVALPATTASKFRLTFTACQGPRARLGEIGLSAAARLEGYAEKQLGKMHPTPLPMWDYYLWPTQAEPQGGGTVVPVDRVLDLGGRLAADGTLEWQVPAGEWVVQRIGMVPTGMRNAPASPEGSGLEVDKLNRGHAQRHFDAFIGEVLRRVPVGQRAAFRRVVADSYEMGSQNWTDGMAEAFRERYGYDPLPWLPVLSGRLLGSADRSERFLWDLRRLVADLVATEYVGGLRDACRPQGLQLWLENYGHWGFPSEFLKYGGASDRIGGEFWVTGDLGSIECRAASSCANTYGKPVVSAEAFTGGPAFRNSPGALKARGDWAFCEGINHFVLHVYIQQPWQDKRPGVNAWFGTEFNRHNTWFEQSKSWIDYLRRSCWLLQQGTRVADVAYFIGEDAPKMTGARKPELPPGRDFDYLNAEVLERSLAVRDGVLCLPHGTSYRVLVLPELTTMRPRVLAKVRELVRDGATVVGRPPARSPSLEDFPVCDAEVRALAAELWGAAEPGETGERRFGKGQVVWGKPLAEILAAAGSGPDFQCGVPLRFTHRRAADGAEIYFVANPRAEAVTAVAAFRAGDFAPELWWPDRGVREEAAVYQIDGGVVRMPLQLGPQGSVFVVFRGPAAWARHRITAVRKDGRELLGTTVPAAPADPGGDVSADFSFALWVKPAGETKLAGEAAAGVVAMGDARNEVFAAPHGGQFGEDHAGCGLAVGTNGVSVHEHGANYFVPILAHPARIEGWTHLSVVYRNNRPSLYLDGKLARVGLQSGHVVHSGAGQGSAAHFRGQCGAIERIGRALSAEEVARLAGATPRPDQAAEAAALRVTALPGKRWCLRTPVAGDYEVATADGARRVIRVAGVPAAREIAGPWEVRFAPGLGAPERVTFERLQCWTTRPEPAIRHFSGGAVYRIEFELPANLARAPGLVPWLDLGEVRDLATVRLNGRDLGTLWLAPWRLELTGALQAGRNTLEVEVVNPWHNRLVGDLALPPEQRTTFLLAATVKKDEPLLPAGLLGPVRLGFDRELAVPPAAGD